MNINQATMMWNVLDERQAETLYNQRVEAQRQRTRRIEQYRRGWQMNRLGMAEDEAILPATQAGWQARQAFMASPVGAELAALGERITEGERVTV